MSSTLALISSVVGFFLPKLIALVQQRTWSPRLKSVVAFAACAVAGTVAAAASGNFDFADVAGSVLAIFTLAQASYHGLWKPSGVAPAIEEATTIGGGELPPDEPLPSEDAAPGA